MQKDTIKVRKPTERLGAYAACALKLLAVSNGALALAAAPGMSIFAQEFVRLYGRRKYAKQTMRAVLDRLKRRTFVRSVIEDGIERYCITDHGRRLFARIFMRETKHARAWDGKWRLVAFDIPEELRSSRKTLRNHLYQMGFAQLQKSIFVYPFPCQREVAELVSSLRLDPYVEWLVATSFKAEAALRKRFGVHARHG